MDCFSVDGAMLGLSFGCLLSFQMTIQNSILGRWYSRGEICNFENRGIPSFLSKQKKADSRSAFYFVFFKRFFPKKNKGIYFILWNTRCTSSSSSTRSIILNTSSACSSLTSTVVVGTHSRSAEIGSRLRSSRARCIFPKSA